MFDFRYHALSLVAVFFALAVGVILGVAIGDKGLLSGAEKDVKSSLRSSVRAAQQHADTLAAQLSLRQRYEQQAFPALVGGRLDGARIGLIELGAPSNQAVALTKQTVQAAGGRLASEAVIDEPVDLASVAQQADTVRFAALVAQPDQPDLIDALGQRIGVQYARGGPLPRRVRQVLFANFIGRLGSLDGVVVVHDPGQLQAGDVAGSQAFENGLVAGLRSAHVPVVGVEITTTAPSQIDWYKNRQISSVDDLDVQPGQTALVFTLAGQADGAYGSKSTADALLPAGIGGAGGG